MSSRTSPTPKSSTPSLVKPTSPIADTEKALRDTPIDTSSDDIASFGPAPDGGTLAWLNAFGGFCICFGCLGFTSCFGVLQEYYSTHQLHDRSPDQIAWIGSVSSFIQFAGGAIGGPMFDRYGAWVSDFHLFVFERGVESQELRSESVHFCVLTEWQILRPATITYVLGLMMVSLCTEYVSPDTPNNTKRD